ncbi:MAG: hypothetical protein AAFO76_12525, partial [Cyanobacteria bacterium J06607_15]
MTNRLKQVWFVCRQTGGQKSDRLDADYDLESCSRDRAGIPQNVSLWVALFAGVISHLQQQ